MFSLLSIIDAGTNPPADTIHQLSDSLGELGARLPGVLSSHAGKTLPNSLYGGHLMWRLAFPSEQHYWDCRASPQWRSNIAPALDSDSGLLVDTVAYRPIRSRVSSGGRRDGIWRCLVMSVDAGAPRESVHKFEQDMLLMPDHVSTIRSWSLGRAQTSGGRRRWTHVWEQEFDDMAGLEGEYMLNPIHWGFIDRWYDPESPQRIVEIVCIVHAAFARNGAVIA